MAQRAGDGGDAALEPAAAMTPTGRGQGPNRAQLPIGGGTSTGNNTPAHMAANLHHRVPLSRNSTPTRGVGNAVLKPVPLSRQSSARGWIDGSRPVRLVKEGTEQAYGWMRAFHKPKRTPVTAKPIHEHKHFNWIVGGGFVLCFNAAYLNAITLSTFHMAPCAHVTGMVAKASMAVAAGDMHILLLYGVSWLCFLSGAFTSGSVITYESFYLGRNYGRALFLEACVLCLGMLIQNILPESPMFVFLLCLACGLQNGITSKYSGNAVRTTHLTGTTTDLAIALAHMVKQRPNEFWKVKMHLASVSGFFLGGFTGWHGFSHHKHASVFASVLIVTFAGLIHTGYVAWHENVSILRVLESKTDFRMHSRANKERDPIVIDTVPLPGEPRVPSRVSSFRSVDMFHHHGPYAHLHDESAASSKSGLRREVGEELESGHGGSIRSLDARGVWVDDLDSHSARWEMEGLSEDDEEYAENPDALEPTPEEEGEEDYVEGDVARDVQRIEELEEELSRYSTPHTHASHGNGAMSRGHSSAASLPMSASRHTDSVRAGGVHVGEDKFEQPHHQQQPPYGDDVVPRVVGSRGGTPVVGSRGGTPVRRTEGGGGYISNPPPDGMGDGDSGDPHAHQN